MSNPHDSQTAERPDNLSDRVVERVLNARLVLEKEAGRSRSGPGEIADAAANGERRELQSLKRVFRDLGQSYRRHRKQTGRPVNPAVREAAYEFRANPSLPALIAVAAHLDRLDLLS